VLAEALSLTTTCLPKKLHVPVPDLCCFIYSGVRCRFHFMDATGVWSAVRPTTSIAEFGLWAYLRRLYLPLSPSLHDLRRYVFRFPLFIFTCHLLSIFRRLVYNMIYSLSITFLTSPLTFLLVIQSPTQVNINVKTPLCRLYFTFNQGSSSPSLNVKTPSVAMLIFCHTHILMLLLLLSRVSRL
jgi:hypothetical protein